MRIDESIVTVRLDRNGPVHISEVIPDVLGQYRCASRLQPASVESRFNNRPVANSPRAQLLQFPLGSFWVRGMAKDFPPGC